MTAEDIILAIESEIIWGKMKLKDLIKIQSAIEKMALNIVKENWSKRCYFNEKG